MMIKRWPPHIPHLPHRKITIYGWSTRALARGGPGLSCQRRYRTLPTSIPSQDPRVTQVIYYRACGQDNLKRDVVPGQNTCLYAAIRQGAPLKTGKTPQHCNQLS